MVPGQHGKVLGIVKAAVIGDPAHHSLSPAIHRAGYAINNLDWHYEAITVQPADLDAFIARINDEGDWAGLSVTAPHKEALLTHGAPDHVATLVGAGNTLVLGEGPTVHNTDIPGFVRAWRARADAPVRSAVIVGAGATARSILVALAGLEVTRVTVVARRPEAAGQLIELGVAMGINTTAQPLEYDPGEVDLVASTVPAVATEAHADRWAASAQYLFDAVYDPWPTPLGQAADPEQAVMTGLDLLAGQAVDQFHLLTGHSITFEQAHAAAVAELEARGHAAP